MVIATLNCPNDAADMASTTKPTDSERSVTERIVELMRIFPSCPLILRFPGNALRLRVSRIDGLETGR